jgi:hypothetical protein
MPAKDRDRENVRNALIKDGWTITDDPLHLKYGKKDMYVYLIMLLGREPAYDFSPTVSRRVHGCPIHIDIIDGKIWIQRDGTEEGVAMDLVRAGVPKDKIVLGFKSEEMRKDTEFAIA